MKLLHLRGRFCSLLGVGFILLYGSDGSLPAEDAAPALPSGTLLWNNGETLRGHLTACDANTVHWQTPEFQEPLSVSVTALRRLETDTHQEQPNDTEPFRIQLRDGSCLLGNIQAIDAEHLTLASKRHGAAVLKRSEIASFSRRQGPTLTYSGPLGVRGWSLPHNSVHRAQPSIGGLPSAGPAGVLFTGGCDSATETHLNIPQLADIQWTLSSSVRPEFTVTLTLFGIPAFKIETWGNQVVLAWGKQFVPLITLQEAEHRQTMRLLWDRTKDKLAVFTDDGRPLCSWQSLGISGEDSAPSPTDPSNAIPATWTLHTKGPDLALESLRIGSWNGEMPSPFRHDSPFLSQTNGKTLQGGIVDADDKSLHFKLEGSNDLQSIDWKEIDTYDFGPSMGAALAPASTELWFNDGTYVKGEMVSTEGSDFHMATSFSVGALKVESSALGKCLFAKPPAPGAEKEPPLVQFDKLVMGPTTLHGTWTPTQEAQMRWKPVGGTASVTLTPTSSWELIRAQHEGQETPRPSAYFCLADGQVLPAALRSVGPDQVGLETSLFSVHQFPASPVAFCPIQRGRKSHRGTSRPRLAHPARGRSATSPRWEILHLKSGETCGHPSLAQAEEIHFSFRGEAGAMSNLRVRLFCHGLDTTQPHLSLAFANWGNAFYFGQEIAEGQIGSTTRLSIPEDKPASIRLRLRPHEVEILVNDQTALKVPCGSGKRSGLGFLMEPSSIWQRVSEPLVIDHFEARLDPGQRWQLPIDLAARATALLVPRAQKEDPPKQILVAANGDLLRGALTSATDRELIFRSGLETLHVPKDRVAGIAWLQKANAPGPATAPQASSAAPAGDMAPPKPESTYHLQLLGGGQMDLTVDHFGVENVQGHSPLLGECRVPVSLVYRIQNSANLPKEETLAMDNWRLQQTPEPVIPESGGESSALASKPAPDFKLPMLAENDFELSAQTGKVVVLDFWATWCGPCVRAMPDLINALSSFPNEKVTFIGVNQGEAKEQVANFLQTHGWKLRVALDTDQTVGRKYNVEGIPFTVVIGPDGKVAWTHTGYSADAAAQTAAAVAKLLK